MSGTYLLRPEYQAGKIGKLSNEKKSDCHNKLIQNLSILLFC